MPDITHWQSIQLEARGEAQDHLPSQHFVIRQHRRIALDPLFCQSNCELSFHNAAKRDAFPMEQVRGADRLHCMANGMAEVQCRAHASLALVQCDDLCLEAHSIVDLCRRCQQLRLSRQARRWKQSASRTSREKEADVSYPRTTRAIVAPSRDSTFSDSVSSSSNSASSRTHPILIASAMPSTSSRRPRVASRSISA